MIVNRYLVKILIIDDSAEDREAYRRYLSKQAQFEYKITEAESAEEGLEELETFVPDLILLDYLLPDLNGLEFLSELQLLKIELPPIVMLTGQGNEAVAVKAMKNGVKDYLVKGSINCNSLVNSINNVLRQERLKKLLAKNQRQKQLITEIALKIRSSSDLLSILDTAVREVRLLLKCDRVVVYRFAPDMSGDIVAESVGSKFTHSLGAKVIDTCFQEGNADTDKYRQGRNIAIDNVYTAGLSKCHLNILEEYEVKANVVAPILLSSSSRLWGLLIAHQCSHSRHWETDEIELLDELAVQLAIALQQSELISNLKNELDNRKKLEGELERLANVLEASEDYIGLSDTAGKVIWNNPQMRQVMGVEDVTQLSIADYHPDWALEIIKKQGIPTALATGTWLGKTALRTKDEEEIPVSQLIIAHKTAEGDVEYISTVMRDLTQQIAAENSLREKAQELNWVNQELLKTTTLLKKRNHELDRFAYVTSHDLKAPLRAIANLAAWLGEDLAGIIPEESQKHLRLMQSRVERLDGLIQGLLEYSRVGKTKSSITTVNVRVLLLEIVDSLSSQPEIEIEIMPNMPILQTNQIALRQVFANLISNAIKYNHRNGGRIEISVEKHDDFYEFAVADNGPGIEPEHHERIFRIFQTLQARDTFESTGIGLSIVKKILEERGDTIRVKSNLGQGATFYFTWHK
jgi:signal transduction histidine kinase/DNA-binding response OmpR family regulator